MLDRRSFIKYTGSCAGALATLNMPKMAVAGAPNPKKLVVVFLSGGADALSMLPPVMDADYPIVRPGNFTFLPPGSGDPMRSALELDGFFGMHPAMSEMHQMYGRGELVAVHATSINELAHHTFSHFEETRFAQSLRLDSGATTGWINRLLGGVVGENTPGAMTITGNPGSPTILQGPEPTAVWTPPSPNGPSGELITRILQMYGIGNEFSNALIDGLATRESMRRAAQNHAQHINFNTVNDFWNFPQQAELMGIMLGAEQSTAPSIGYLEFAGMDHHLMERDGMGYPWGRYRNLSQGIGALRQALVNFGVWQDTMVVIYSEFGRSVTLNGSPGSMRGTDHGYGQAGFIISGNPNMHAQFGMQGVVVAQQWPGLTNLIGNSALRSTSNFLGILRGYLQAHYNIDNNVMNGIISQGGQQQ